MVGMPELVSITNSHQSRATHLDALHRTLKIMHNSIQDLKPYYNQNNNTRNIISPGPLGQ